MLAGREPRFRKRKPSRKRRLSARDKRPHPSCLTRDCVRAEMLTFGGAYLFDVGRPRRVVFCATNSLGSKISTISFQMRDFFAGVGYQDKSEHG